MLKKKNSGKEHSVKKSSEKEISGKRSVSARDYGKLITKLNEYKAENKLLSSELKRLKENSGEKEDQYNELSNIIFQFFSSGYFVLSKDGVIRESNLHGAKMLGKSPSGLIRKKFSGFIPAKYRNEFSSFRQTLITTGKRAECEVELLSTGNISKPVRISGVSAKNSEKLYILATDFSGIKELVSRVKESEFRHHCIVTSLIDGYVSTTMSGKIIESNEAYRKMVGYSEKELSKLTYRDLTPEKWHDFEERIVKDEIFKSGFSRVYEKEYRRKDGTIFPVELRSMLIYNEAGENEGIWAIVRDLTERNLVRDQLIENEYWLKEAQRIGKLGSYKLNFTTNEIIGSAALKTVLGMDDLPNKTTDLKNRIALEFREELENYLKNFVIGGKNTFDKEFQIIREDNKERRWVWGYGNLGFDFAGNPVSMFGVLQDITDRKKAEEAIRKSETEYRETLNAIPDWIILVDTDLRLVNMSKSFRETCLQQGLSPVPPGKHITGIIPFFSVSIIEAIEHVFHCGTPVVLNENIDLLERSLFTEIRIIPMIRNKHVDKVIIVFRDKSKEKEVADLKIRNIEQKEVLLREIHHRVKNNLSIVISLLNFQLRKYSDQIPNHVISEVMIQIRSMALIHEHLYFSETFDKIPLDSYIKSLLSNIARFYPGNKIQLGSNLDHVDITLEKALPVGLIINELLTNAYKYAFPGGESGVISIDLKTDEEGLITITVSDNGIGLPESITVEAEESLGLFIIGILVKQLEGTIKIIRDKGTTFIIRFRNINDE